MSPSISPLIVRRNRYDVSGLVEAQFEPGSRGRVLRNLLGIARKREMDRAEAEAQLLAFDRFSSCFMTDHKFTTADIVVMHRVWLGGIYPWAGKFRQVQVSKSGFLFAAPTQIPRLMAELETGPLRKHTPCLHASRERVIEGLAETQVELVLITPSATGTADSPGCSPFSWDFRLRCRHSTSAGSKGGSGRFISMRFAAGWTGTTSRCNRFSRKLSRRPCLGSGSALLRPRGFLPEAGQPEVDSFDGCGAFDRLHEGVSQ